MQTYFRAYKGKSRRTSSPISLEMLRIAWAIIRLPVLTLLEILEPLVAFVLSALALLGVLTTIFFKLVGSPNFPAWTMLFISLGFGIALAAYRYLIDVLSR